MRIKKFYKIGGHKVKVVFKKLEKNIATSSLVDNLIEIDIGATQDQRESALIHEFGHFINSTFSRGKNHIILDSLSEQLYQIFKDNNMLK